ncbi:MAG: LysR family transcriptional regulator substrate-binding protein, partial [Eubacterium sp.]
MNKAAEKLYISHPLAKKEKIRFEELEPYPCLSCEQGERDSTFLAEEILSDRQYNRVIKANERATMLNLMIGVHGYTLCSGVICEELDGSDYRVIPFNSDKTNPNYKMTIGYISKKGSRLNSIGEIYIEEIGKYLA